MKKLSVLFAAVMMFVSVGVAKAQKIASLDYNAILTGMPEVKKMNDDLESYSNTKGGEIEKQVATWRNDVQAYQAEAGKLTADQQKAKEDGLRKKQAELAKLDEEFQTTLANKRDAAVKPIIDKINAAVTKVAKANGFDHVLEAKTIYFTTGTDATPLVKKELGLK